MFFHRCTTTSIALFAIVVVLTGLLPQSEALAFGDDIHVGGMVSQGYLQTTENNFLIDDSKDGSFEFQEATIHFMAMPVDRLRIGVQLYARDFGSEGNTDVVLDWAYGDYRWRDFLGVRAGRIKMPIGFYNKVRDIDVARTSILLPQSVYTETQRDFGLAYEGVNVYGNLGLGGGGSADYEAFFGTLNVPNMNSIFWRDAIQNIADGYSAGVVAGLSAATGAPANSISTYSTSNNSAASFDNFYGYQIVWNTPINGLRLGHTNLTGSVEFGTDVTVDADVPTGNAAMPIMESSNSTEVRSEVDIPYLATFSVEYIWNKLTVAAEYKENRYETKTYFDNTLASESVDVGVGYYGMVGYQVFNWMTLSTYYSELYPDNSDRDSSHRQWLKDAAFSTRFDLNSNWLLKLELHSMNGTGSLSRLQNPDGFEESWMLYAAKATYRF